MNLAVIGAPGVGKSALTIRLVNDMFLDEYDPTIQDSYRAGLEVDGERSRLEILDTAGQEEYSSMRDDYLRGSKGVLVVFSLTSRESFDEARGFRDHYVHVKDVDHPPLVLVGNKSDLDGRRQVTKDEGRALADRWGVPYVETSAKTDAHVRDAFAELVREVRRS